MGHLPVSADTFFDDFSFELLEYNVSRNKTITATYRGLSNSDEYGDYICFLMSDIPQIAVGDTLCTSDGFQSFEVSRIAYDYYNGKPELLKAYY